MILDNQNFENTETGKDKFPRKLSGLERELLFSVLPEYKPGYKLYRDKIENLFITGFGRFENGNLVLGEKNTKPDISFPSTPVFAAGTVMFSECVADINIHEEIENEIECDITFSKEVNFDKLHELKRWSYSEWNPGEKAPNDNSEVREISVEKNKFVLAIADTHKKIWLHNYVTGVNHLIPVSNFYNYLMLIKNIRDAAAVSKPALFFNNHIKYTDTEIVSAFLIYNKYFKKFKIEYSSFEHGIEIPKRKSIFNFLKRG